MCARWVSTVRTDRYSCPAISAFVGPSPSIRSTLTCRAGAERFAGVAGLGFHRQHNDLRVRELGTQPGDRPETEATTRITRADRASGMGST